MPNPADKMSEGQRRAEVFISKLRERQLIKTQEYLAELIDANFKLGGDTWHKVVKAHAVVGFRELCFKESEALVRRCCKALHHHGEKELAGELASAYGITL